MRATEVLREEHDAVLVVLDALEQAVTAAEHGLLVPKSIFEDVEEFFTVFVDRCHHGKEEAAVFSQLDAASGNAGLIEQLETEHETGKRLAAAFRQALANYSPGDIASARNLAAASRAYDGMLREHIEAENSELFVAMEQSLASEDEALVREFDRHEIEEIGEGTHERLHVMIDSLPLRIAPWIEEEIASR